MKGLSQLMKQAQEMQENFQKNQEELSNLKVIGESGAGLVKIEMSGRHDASRVSIDESLMDDKEMLEDLIVAAINDAVRKIETENKDKMSELTGGINLPPGFKMPF